MWSQCDVGQQTPSQLPSSNCIFAGQVHQLDVVGVAQDGLAEARHRGECAGEVVSAVDFGLQAGEQMVLEGQDMLAAGESVRGRAGGQMSLRSCIRRRPSSGCTRSSRFCPCARS